MYDTSFLCWTAVLGAVYCYSVLRTHFLAVRVARGTFLPRSKCGEIRLGDLRYAQTSAYDPEDSRDAYLAALYLRTGNVVAATYLASLFLFAFFQILSKTI